MTDDESDATNARYWAISGIGYGRATTPAQAIENYVTHQSGMWKQTIFKTRKAWENSLRVGDSRATLFMAPEGITGYGIDHRGLHWTVRAQDGSAVNVEVKEGERLDRDPVTPYEMIARLAQFEVKRSISNVDRIHCEGCDDNAICDVEHGDTLDVLARTALGHLAGEDELNHPKEQSA